MADYLKDRNQGRWIIDSEICRRHNFPMNIGLYKFTLEQLYLKNITDKIGFAHVAMFPGFSSIETYLPSTFPPYPISSLKTIFVNSSAKYYDFHSLDQLETFEVGLFERNIQLEFRLIDSNRRNWPGEFSLVIKCERVE